MLGWEASERSDKSNIHRLASRGSQCLTQRNTLVAARRNRGRALRSRAVAPRLAIAPMSKRVFRGHVDSLKLCALA